MLASGGNVGESISVIWKGSGTSAPSNPELYWAYYNTDDNIAYIYDGSSWVVFASHTIVIDTAVAPTCGLTGVTEGAHCLLCGHVFAEQEILPATGIHDYVDDVCSVCGDHRYFDVNSEGVLSVKPGVDLPTSVNIPSSIKNVTVTVIGESAFEGECFLQNVTLPDTLVRIEKLAFADCSSLQEIGIPDSVIEIGEEAFECCLDLSTVTISQGSNLSRIGSLAFSNCAISSFSIPSGVTIIEDSVFGGDSSLIEFGLHDAITSIGSYAFKDCSFPSITVPKTATNLSYAFGCYSGEVEFEEGTIKVPDESFYLSSATKVVIPESVESIGINAFRNSNIVNIELRSITPPSLGENAFTDSSIASGVGTITVPFSYNHSVLAAYQNAGWGNNIIFVEAPLKVGDRGPAGGYIFYDCDADNDSGNADGLISSECGWQYLEAAPNDVDFNANDNGIRDLSVPGHYGYIFGLYRLSENGNNMYVNGSLLFSEENCTRTGIGEGKRNTRLLIDAMGSTAYFSMSPSNSQTCEYYAAKVCDEFSVTVGDTVYDDWFQPSKDELAKMYEVLAANGIGGFLGPDDSEYAYWSSSEEEYEDSDGWGATSAWFCSFATGKFSTSIGRSSRQAVRAIRAFCTQCPSGHEYVAVTIQEQSQENDEITRYSCSVCGQSYEEVTAYRTGTKGYGTVLSSSGRTTCGWVQLWEDGPCFAEFNLGSTATAYSSDNTTVSLGGKYTWGGFVANDTNNVVAITLWDQYDKEYYTQYVPQYNQLSTDLNGQKDSATYIWGNNWRMPTESEIDALISGLNQTKFYGDYFVGDNVIITWCNGTTSQYCSGCTIKGFKISGKPGTPFENNSIFLPVDDAYSTTYWTSNSSSDNGVTLYTQKNSEEPSISSGLKYGLRYIRPVYVENPHVYGDPIIIQDQSCTDSEIVRYTCVDCEHSYTDITKKPTGHSYSSEWTSNDLTHWHAATCGHDVKTGIATHTFVPEFITYPTQTTDGLVENTCSVCGRVVQETIPAGTYYVGMTGPAGGLIFYDCDADNTETDPDGKDNLISSTCGWRYLEAAPTNMYIASYNSYSTPKVGGTATVYNRFSSRDFGAEEAACKKVYQNTGTGIGTGKENTQYIMQNTSKGSTYIYNSQGQLTIGTNSYAYSEDMCNNLTYGGYSDWFLPSRNELGAMFDNLAKKGLGGFVSGYYQSSSGTKEGSGDDASYFQESVCLSSTNEYSYDKDYSTSSYVRPVRRFL